MIGIYQTAVCIPIKTCQRVCEREGYRDSGHRLLPIVGDIKGASLAVVVDYQLEHRLRLEMQQRTLLIGQIYELRSSGRTPVRRSTWSGDK